MGAKDDLISQETKKYFQNLGIEVSTDIENFEMKKNEYFKVDDKTVGRVDAIFANIGIPMINMFASIADVVDKKRKEKKKEEAIDALSLNNVGKDISIIENKKTELKLLDNLYNNKLEIVKNKDGLYIKIPR